MKFSRKNYLITGASSGIGKATAIHLDALGARVVLVARNEESMKEIARGLKNQPILIPYDFEQNNEMEKIFLTCKENGISLDGMVHCAGIGGGCPLKVNDDDFAKRMMQINYFSFLELCRFFIKKKYVSEGAAIVAMSSISARTMEKGMIQYAAAKSAVETAVRIASKELAGRKIRVNALEPAFVKTPLAEGIEQEADFLQRQPLGIIEPENIGEIIAFLLSEKAKYITGALIPVSAGYDYGL